MLYTYINRHAGTPDKNKQKNISSTWYIIKQVNNKGKRHNRVHPDHFATQQGTPFYPAGMSAADWSTLVFTLPRRKMAWVHPVVSFPLIIIYNISAIHPFTRVYSLEHKQCYNIVIGEEKHIHILQKVRRDILHCV